MEKTIEHKHIPPKHADWRVHNYQCVCGFKTGNRLEFDKHLEETDNQKIQGTENRK